MVLSINELYLTYVKYVKSWGIMTGRFAKNVYNNKIKIKFIKYNIKRIYINYFRWNAKLQININWRNFEKPTLKETKQKINFLKKKIIN